MPTPSTTNLATRIEEQLLGLEESRVALGLPISVDASIVALASQALVELARRRLREHEPDFQRVKIEFQY